jgi:pimeloyl-ACP methyl ester carboxylesterase
MTEPRRRSVDSNGVRLNVFELAGDARGTPLVMLHGMRDVSQSLLPIAAALIGDRPVYLLDLRGHGASDRPGNYAMPQFIYDLHRVVTTLAESGAALFGHSLGGHIVSRFAALFPDLTRAAVIVEGLGPPRRDLQADPKTALRVEAERLLGAHSIPATSRPLPSIAFAAERLLANNPRLTPERARALAEVGTSRDADGTLSWAFDPRVGTVFGASTTEDSSRYWRAMGCPTCIVSGALAGEYWGRQMPGRADRAVEFGPGELEERIACFADVEHHALYGSGHMVHFDEPERLAEITRDFLRRRL